MNSGSGSITLGDLDMLDVACHRCERRGRLRLLSRYGLPDSSTCVRPRMLSYFDNNSPPITALPVKSQVE
jgi:hypothetical protein